MAPRTAHAIVHLVWETEGRRNLVGADHEEIVYEAVRGAVGDLGLPCLAVGAAWNHVHTLVGGDPSIAFVDVVELCKRRARHRWSDGAHRSDGDVDELVWADGYASCGVRAEEIPRVSRYLDLQKTHHEAGDLWARFERGIPRDDAEIPRSA
jgi:REP element-mobilizing transposase RayT